jgi:GNAT superfamily N-acetyltransferase
MIALSELDRLRFGHVTAKVDVDAGDNIESILADCIAKRVQLLIARCSTLHLDKVQEMEQLGFFLTDTLVYYRKKSISARSLELPEDFSVRPAGPQDAAEVEKLAARSFQGYHGHYHADPRLDRMHCDEVYSSWAANSCGAGGFCDHMMLITSVRKDEIAAFATLKRHSDAEFEGVLFGVDPAYQGKGLYGQLIDLSQQWGIENRFTRMIVSTQVTNMAVQKAWCRQGFEPFKSLYTLHKWLD